MKKINILHTEWSTGWGGQEMRILSESLALRDTYGAKVLLATRDGAVLGQKASEAGLIEARVFEPNKYDKNKVRDELGIPRSAVCVGNMGLFREVKRLDIFLNIALSIHKTHPNTHFLLVGSGDTESFVRDFISMQEISEFVTLLPFSPAKMLSAMDIFMLTSSSEGVPQTLMQALFMQKACIATNVGSVRDLFFKDNFLLYGCDENQLKSALKLLLEHPQMLENLSLNKQEFVRANFSLEKSDVYGAEILGSKE